MTRHPFEGVWCLSCANFAVKRTLQDYRHLHDESTVRAINRSIYVVDLIRSICNTFKGLALTREATELLRRGGFDLAKFVSSDRQLMKALL